MNPRKWHEVYRNDDEKKLFVGKDGKSGLCRSEFDWRSTDAIHRESGLPKQRVEEILDHWCQRGVVVQHSKDPEKWGYWERVGATPADPDLVKKDHDDRTTKNTTQAGAGGKKAGSTRTPPGSKVGGGATAAGSGGGVKAAPKP